MRNVGVNDERARSGLCHFPESDTLSEEEKNSETKRTSESISKENI
jgi:hypothetical protein